MVSEWREFKFSDIGIIITGKTPSTVNKDYFNGQIPFVTPRDFIGDMVISKTERYLTSLGMSSVQNSIIPKNAVMVSCIGSDLGKAAIAGKKCVTNQQINSIIVHNYFDYKYIYYNLSLRKQEIYGRAGGSAQPILNKTHFSQLSIILPPLSEQRTIAHILGTLDDKIELNRRMNETLEAMARALFKTWFVDFEPVRAKLEGRWRRGQSLPGLPAHLYDLFPDRLIESELGEIPERWNVVTMRSLSEAISKGTTPNKMILAKASDEPKIPFIKVKDILESGEITRGNLEHIAKSIHESSLKRSILKTDDLLFSIAGTIGRTAYIDSDLNETNINQAIAFIRLKDISNYFALCWMNLRSDETKNFISAKIVQGVQANASLESVGDIPVIVPNQDIFKGWNELVNPIISDYRIRQWENRILAKLRDALLPKLISGKLRITDSERYLEKMI